MHATPILQFLKKRGQRRDLEIAAPPGAKKLRGFPQCIMQEPGPPGFPQLPQASGSAPLAGS
ncbi:MAG: hypothetical protein A2V78_08085 [Betaproteobacteria bacterium RBG_16_64_18]|nr:MAG: hypothetical protein A2V78_08085 [Betaproteobacteria bacterium RBG_16_64_18]OGA39062.1 MAG: hypothetical protein A3G26_08525 [Betaproteobacteria bacterium RIFCSPLOWO2_12_FULL_65_110]